MSFILDRLSAALDWGSAAGRFHHGSELQSYTTALHLLDVALAQSQSLEIQYSTFSRNKTVRRAHQLAVDAAAEAIAQDEPELAVQLLDQGRGILLRQLGRFRTALDDLREKDQVLADRFRFLSNQIGGIMLPSSKVPLKQGDDAFPEDDSARYVYVDSLVSLANQIRSL